MFIDSLIISRFCLQILETYSGPFQTSMMDRRILNTTLDEGEAQNVRLKQKLKTVISNILAMKSSLLKSGKI